MLDEDLVDLLRDAYLIARGNRMNELRGRYRRRFDDTGLDPYSWTFGRVSLVEEWLEIPGEARANPVSINNAAVADAHKAFAAEIADNPEEAFRH